MEKTDMSRIKDKENTYNTVVIGAGAAGLFYAAADSPSDDTVLFHGAPDSPSDNTDDFDERSNSGTGGKLIIEKTSHPGQKLLMSGNGQCNITHGGSIKDFIGKYGENGRKIRGCLYKHNNLELMDFIESLGVPLTEHEDGKVFPVSMKSSDVLDALLRKAAGNKWEIKYNAEVASIKTDAGRSGGLVELSLSDGTILKTRKLVIATGGASYPSTGSDGSFFGILQRDLNLNVIEPRPALTPIYVQDFDYEELAGISFDDVELRCGKHTTHGPLLITHRGFSGPAVLHMSQYVCPGDELIVNFLPGNSADNIYRELLSRQPGNKAGTANVIASAFGIPKAFANKLADSPELSFCRLSGKDLRRVAVAITSHAYSVSGTGGWNDAMVTAGGVSLGQIDFETMKIKCPADIRIIGEALDVNGDEGGYNLQFAYSSAMTAL